MIPAVLLVLLLIEGITCQSTTKAAVPQTTAVPATTAPYMANILGFYLWDVVQGQELQQIFSGQVININSFENLTVIAKTNPPRVGTVWFFINAVFVHSSPNPPYTINYKSNAPMAMAFSTGQYLVEAIPYEFNTNNFTNPGPSGTSLTVSFNIVQNTIDPTTIIGPPVLQTGAPGNVYLQMMNLPATSNIQVTALDILFSPDSYALGTYDLQIYQPANTPKMFSLATSQLFTVDQTAFASAPSRVVISPPVPVLAGQYIALAGVGVPLPLPLITQDSTVSIYTLGTENIQNVILPTINGSGPAWRVEFTALLANNANNNNLALAAGPIAGIVVGSVVGLALLVGIGVFVVWRYRRGEDNSNNFTSLPLPSAIPSMQRTMTPKMSTSSSSQMMESNTSYRSRGPTLKTTGFVMCSRCSDEKDKGATVACVDCKNYFCGQCSHELHFGTGSGNWSNHVIRPLKLVTAPQGDPENPILYCPECGTARLDVDVCQSCKFNFKQIPKENTSVRIYT